MSPGIFSKIFKGRYSKNKVSITSINIRLGFDVHSLKGMKVNDATFEYALPYQNKLGSGILPENLKGPSVNISAISIETPFTLLEVTPHLPKEIAYMESLVFNMKIKAPDTNYTGPLSIRLETESKDEIDLHIEKIILVNGQKRIELNDSLENIATKKSQIFRKNIQLYKVLSYGNRVNMVQVNKPFEIVSLNPQPPFTLDKKDSYVLSMLIKSPEFSYAGSLEILFS